MSTALTRIAIAAQANVPVLWWGKPGVGKTSILNQIGPAIGMTQTVCITLAMRQPEDIGGIPVPDKNDPHQALRIYEPWAVSLSRKPGLLIIDELNRAANRATMNAALRVLQERFIGDLPLHKDTRIVATANPPDTDSGAADIPAALANRLYHEYGECEFDGWQNWMMGGSGAVSNIPVLSASWEDHVGTARAQVVAFVNAKRNLESNVPKDPIMASGPYPTRRSWTNAATLWAAGGLAYGSLDVGIQLVAGCVGEGPAMEFMAFVKDADLPDPKGILEKPDQFMVPNRSDRVFAVLGSVVSLARRIGSKESYQAAEIVLCRAAEQGARDSAGAALGALMSPDPVRKLPPTAAGWMLSPKTATIFMPVLKAAGWVGGR